MSLEIRLDDRHAEVELLSRDENRIRIKIDDQVYEVDITPVENGIYSLLHSGRSYTVVLAEGDNAKKYLVNTPSRSYNLEVIDAESRYLMSRRGQDLGEAENQISSPMPGKVVKIPVKTGEKVEAGQTLIIISAMKMESEYKAGKAGTVKEILVAEGDTIEGNQTLITIE